MQKNKGIGKLEVKKPYRKPELKKWGTVADLTKTGLSTEGGDAKSGSIPYSKGQ